MSRNWTGCIVRVAVGGFTGTASNSAKSRGRKYSLAMTHTFARSVGIGRSGLEISLLIFHSFYLNCISMTMFILTGKLNCWDQLRLPNL